MKTSTAKRRPRAARGRRSEWRLARIARKNPGLVVWVVLFVSILVGLEPRVPTALRSVFSDHLAERSLRTVASVLDIIGPEVVIDSVEVREFPPGVAAMYERKRRTISVSPETGSYDDDDFLALACHEVVHAMFDQKDWPGYYGSTSWEAYLLAEETAADILGAHIAGRVRARRGGNGRELTRRLVQVSRDFCDTQHPRSYYQTFARARAAFGLDVIDPEIEHLVSTHVGSAEMVDDMDRICRTHPNPWDAARIIAESYLQPNLEAEKEQRVVSEWLPRAEFDQ